MENQQVQVTTSRYFIEESDFEKTLDRATVKNKSYDGMQETTEFAATLINSEVREAQLKKQAMVFQWSESEFSSEKEKKVKDAGSQTEVFMSFFSPEKAHEDLARSKTLWKVYLESDGRRYEGKAEKIKLLTSEIQNLFPEHSRFATPYKVIFPVALATVEPKKSMLTVTGPVGTASLEFQPSIK
jgi:hypothetical protein